MEIAVYGEMADGISRFKAIQSHFVGCRVQKQLSLENVIWLRNMTQKLCEVVFRIVSAYVTAFSLVFVLLDYCSALYCTFGQNGPYKSFSFVCVSYVHFHKQL